MNFLLEILDRFPKVIFPWLTGLVLIWLGLSKALKATGSAADGNVLTPQARQAIGNAVDFDSWTILRSYTVALDRLLAFRKYQIRRVVVRFPKIGRTAVLSLGVVVLLVSTLGSALGTPLDIFWNILRSPLVFYLLPNIIADYFNLVASRNWLVSPKARDIRLTLRVALVIFLYIFALYALFTVTTFFLLAYDSLPNSFNFRETMLYSALLSAFAVLGGAHLPFYYDPDPMHMELTYDVFGWAGILVYSGFASLLWPLSAFLSYTAGLVLGGFASLDRRLKRIVDAQSHPIRYVQLVSVLAWSALFWLLVGVHALI